MLDGLQAAGLAVERLTWRHFGAETMAIYKAVHPNADARNGHDSENDPGRNSETDR